MINSCSMQMVWRPCYMLVLLKTISIWFILCGCQWEMNGRAEKALNCNRESIEPDCRRKWTWWTVSASTNQELLKFLWAAHPPFFFQMDSCEWY